MPKVTVILSSYNHEEYLEESIRSVLNQTWTDFELIIIDDSSTDESWSVIERQNDPRIRTVRMKKNSNCAYFNALQNYAHGEYVAIAHCDDKWAPEKLEKQVAYLDTHKNVAACFTRVQVIDETDTPLPDNATLFGQVFAQPNRSRFEWLRTFFYEGGKLCHPSVLLRYSVFKDYNMAAWGLDSFPDFIKWVRLCGQEEIWILQEKLSFFRIRANGENTSGDQAEKQYRNRVESYFLIPEFYDICSGPHFLEIFPEAKQYVVGGEINQTFAFAKLLLNTPYHKGYHLYGLQLLYDLLKSEETRQELEERYNYTLHDFNLEKQKEDIFGIFSEQRFINCQLLLDYGEGYHREDVVVCDHIYVPEEGMCVAEFHLDSLNNERTVKQFRIAPGEGGYWKIGEVKVSINKTETVSLRAKNSRTPKAATDAFCTIHPEYESIAPLTAPVQQIKVTFWAAPLSLEEVETLQAEQNQVLELQNQVDDLKNELSRALAYQGVGAELMRFLRKLKNALANRK